MEERAQTALEYILLLGGILMFIILLIVLWQEQVYRPAANTVGNAMQVYRNLTNVS